jgi:glucosamine--fructose-6-phosphate aminotransferase (isomerizing)
VASTKAFTAQVAVLIMLAVKMAKAANRIDSAVYTEIIAALNQAPHNAQEILCSAADVVERIAAKYKDASDALYLGRGYLFPIALEGALKLKEISYIHAEGYPAGEMKHGPIALIDEQMPVVALALQDEYYEKITSNIQQVTARKGNVIAIVTRGDKGMSAIASDVIEIPPLHPVVAPLLSVLPLQMLAYNIAVLRGCNVDQPRNLAKSVTVE